MVVVRALPKFEPESLRPVVFSAYVLFLHLIIGSVLYPWVNCTGIRTLNAGFRGSPLTHGYKTDPIMIHKRVTGYPHVLFLHIIIGSVLYPWVNCTGIRTLNPGFRGVYPGAAWRGGRWEQAPLTVQSTNGISAIWF